MKISFEIKGGWYKSEVWRLVGFEIGEIWSGMLHDTEIMIISITILKLNLELWVNIDKAPVQKGYIQED